jgi:phosphatidylserine/phosphatidylglycerophosphate/cardiolipin synthase-like enzyme
MSLLRRALFSLSVITLTGCPSEPEPFVDSGRRDTGVPSDRAVIDTDVETDSGVTMMDASAPDVGTDARTIDAARDGSSAPDVVADAAPSCPCPPIPAACTPPEIDSPTFSPGTSALQTQLNDVVACASRTLDMALYQVNSPCFVDVILARLAAVPALQVRIVTDNDTCPIVMGARSCALSRLEGNPRVQIIDDARTTLMHHKFIIADGTRVWVASANMTRQSFCTDENNALVIEDAAAITSYSAEFRRMFELRSFGPIEPEPDPSPTARFGVYFSPRTPTTRPPRWHAALIDAINNARTSVDFAVSAFTRQDIADALSAAHRRGVRVRGIVDSSYAMDPAVLSIRMAGADVRTDSMHSKVLIVDASIVTTGSANWSTNAWTNNENSLWIRDANIASVYRAQFDRSFSMATPLP